LEDVAVAVNWLGKGAELGDAHSMDVLGAAYLQGVATVKDTEEAVMLIRKAAELGWAEAQFLLNDLTRGPLPPATGDVLP
jgi:TPR repeat protein